MDSAEAKLYIRFHGRVIEHLGIDMYQSPVAAIAELISNAWDADATEVRVTLPGHLGEGAEIHIVDDGEGMTLTQCQERYLKVGYNRRTDRGSEKTPGGRPVMGRKGIGKFAGFGIAGILEVETVSRETGEKTVFRLDVDRLTGEGTEDRYAYGTRMEVEVLEYLPASEGRKADHGTRIKLQRLTLKRTPNPDRFRESMARRFLLLERVGEFSVLVNGLPIASEAATEDIEFDFPGDYREDEMPVGMRIEDGWGVESLRNGAEIRWRFVFYPQPIRDDDLTGVSIFSHHKLAQRPFFFNLSGGLGGQQALSYLSGRVKAEYIDDQEKDLISTERQRINWEAEEALPLLDWGQRRLKELMRIWQDRRASAKVEAMNKRLTPFSARLDRLENYERRIVQRALKSIARISVLSDDEFTDLANAILTAWEGGRLRDLIDRLADSAELDSQELVRILFESRVMTALHAAERVKVQLNLIKGLEERVQRHELELAVRDYIAENPWLISPEWETFEKERGVSGLVSEVAKDSLDKEEAWNARVDLVLSSGDQLLVLEFMRPGVTADWDHIGRFERYVLTLRDAIAARRSQFRDVTGVMVADRLERPLGFQAKLKNLRSQGMDATDWPGLLERAKRQWQEYFDILYNRAPEDARMASLADRPKEAPQD
ncbi:hypothetical protein Acsp03_63580 [Actinomadura sp. NBRC 104412]|uniref:ATP-binding protein n=1 Tax=Actinomadura sp. NBRC 104412 TaxID=3032203 RepID=UPI0024A44B2A|nr:ATP-binding protein [Actinomadura sp. NBRC 104412]GLZ08892.1 hypothetical protein Acsp03_63580 [Actinomadura sp. NBRC 104412]